MDKIIILLDILIGQIKSLILLRWINEEEVWVYTNIYKDRKKKKISDYFGKEFYA